MFAVRRFLVFISLVSTLFFLSACQGESSSAAGSGSRSLARNFQWLPLYGDGANDSSGAIARVGDVEITARDLDMFLEELPSDQKSKYAGPDGERLLLKRMIDAVLMVQGAVEKELYNDQDVARTLISHRRNTLESAMLNYGLLKGRKPSDEEIRQSFMATRDQYRQMGIVNARHIECKTKEQADEAYRRLVEGGKGNDWVAVMVEFSVNEESKEMEGSTGWFNQGGIIPFIRGSEKFTKEAYVLEKGLHPPFLVVDRWHIVEVLARENERPMSFNEAKDQVELAMMPGWQDALVKGYLRDARKKVTVEMFGDFAPGKGLNADELFSRALAVIDPARKIELLNLLYTDYPESERADDALFLAATVALESWQDGRVAGMYLGLLLDGYPDSDLVDDATFLQDNLYNPEVLNPKSMEELRK